MSISTLPEGFNPHKGIKRVFDGRRKAIESGEGVDWGFAEALAFGTLVSEGRPRQTRPYYLCCILYNLPQVYDYMLRQIRLRLADSCKGMNSNHAEAFVLCPLTSQCKEAPGGCPRSQSPTHRV